MPEVLNESLGIKRAHDVAPESLKNHISARDMGTRLVREGPRAGTKQLKPSHESAKEELNSFVFSFYSDMPDEVIESAAQALVSIMHSSISEEQKINEIEGLLDQSLEGAQFESLRSITQLIPPAAEDDGLESDQEDAQEDLEEDLEEEEQKPLFVALNDPVRMRDKSIVRPQEIDSHWLESKLQGLDVRVDEILDILEQTETTSNSVKLEVLENKLGLENFGLVQLLAKNSAIVLWYTKLARAATGVEREEIMEQIAEKGLSLEDVAHDYMDQDLPREVDLRVVGRPISVPLYQNLKLPPGSTRFTTHDFEQYNIPANEPALDVDWPLKSIDELPEYAQPSFKGLETLNVVQSKVSDVAVNSDINVLLCAPTGAGKSNVALLALTRCLHVNGDRAVYIAPLKALVQEQVQTLQARLPGMTVAELSGDQSISREQLETVDVIVATPEKWDIVSRKPSNVELIRSVGLIVVDEIHLLHDERRGSVIENIVVRHKQQVAPPRFLGLSATLPNFKDVADFLNVSASGLFFFDARFRPVPLEQQFVGVTTQGPLKQVRVINETCAAKVTEVVVEGKKQALVFVHSRKDTAATRDVLAEKTALSQEQIGIHHAGLNREERVESEEKFRTGTYRVLVCTATLAWGVNLPAAAVIIKGTQYYDPGLEGWKQLGPQDVMQMFGRAGRPGFDSQGLGIILTTQKYLGYFASIASLSLPIQSHLIARITDSMNAEIVTYNIRTIDEAVKWLEQTFWAVRLKSAPEMYGDSYELADIAHSALLKLHNSGACRYDYPSVRPTFQGIVSAEFYISPDSVALYTQQLKPWMADIDVIRVFARSAEFSTLSVRRGEANEIRKLAQLVPFPLRDEVESKYAKIAILLQAHISRLPLNGLSLSSDMAYIAQSASRLFRAFFEISIALKWSKLARICHNLFLMVDKRLWMSGKSYFRQFDGCPTELLKRVENSQLPWQRYFDLEEGDIGEILRLSDPSLVATAHKYLSIFPRFSLTAQCQPVSTDWALVSTEAVPLFEYDGKFHQNQERFWLLIENQSGEVLHSRSFSMKDLSPPSVLSDGLDVFKTTACIKLHASSITRKYTPYLFARLFSERWLGSESETPINLRKLEPPSHITAASLINATSAAETQKHLADDGNAEFTVARALRPILESADRSAYIGMPPCKELKDCVQTVIDSAAQNGQRVLIITALPVYEMQGDESIVQYLDAEAGERLSRSQADMLNKFKDIECIICDNLHRIGSLGGQRYELLLTRIRKVLPNLRRIVGFGYPVTSARSVAQWLGASKSDVVNFGFDVIQNPPSIVLNPWRGPYSLLTSFRSVLDLVEKADSVLLVCSTRYQCEIVAQELELQGIEGVSRIDRGSDTHKLDVETGSKFHSRVNVATVTTAVRVCASAKNVILFGTLELAPSDLLKLVGLAEDQAVVFSDRLDFDQACVDDPIPLESNLAPVLEDAMIPEIANGEIRNPQEAVDWLATTFLYRRLRANAAYYGSQDLQDWVSEVIESAFERLASVGAVSMDEETLDVDPLALCHIISREGVDLESVLSDSEIDGSRFARDATAFAGQGSMAQDAGRDIGEFESSVRIMNARIDYAVTTNSLSHLFRAVDVRQALMRRVRNGWSSLRQIPEVGEATVMRCNDAGIQSVQDFIAIEDDELRCQLLGFDIEDERMVNVAEFVNSFPVVDIISASVRGTSEMEVEIERDIEPDDEITEDGWYLVAGDARSDTIWGFKHLEPIRSGSLKVTLHVTTESNLADGSVWLMCGSYIDADKESPISGLDA